MSLSPTPFLLLMQHLRAEDVKKYDLVVSMPSSLEILGGLRKYIIFFLWTFL